nr:hypothetical protein Iba_chr13dCG5990 [Ipomoea batatas]
MLPATMSSSGKQRRRKRCRCPVPPRRTENVDAGCSASDDATAVELSIRLLPRRVVAAEAAALLAGRRSGTWAPLPTMRRRDGCSSLSPVIAAAESLSSELAHRSPPRNAVGDREKKLVAFLPAEATPKPPSTKETERKSETLLTPPELSGCCRRRLRRGRERETEMIEADERSDRHRNRHSRKLRMSKREGMSSSTAARRWNTSSLFQPPERSCRAMPPIHYAELGFTPKGEGERSPARSRRRRNPPLSMAELWEGLMSLLFEELYSAHGSPRSLAGC